MITIGFSRHKGFAPLSWLIMVCESTNFSHAYIRFRAESLDRDLIYQATGSGVNFVGRTLFEQTAQVIEEYELKISDEDRRKLLQWCVDNAGKPYGHLQLFGITLIRFFKLFGIKISNPFGNGDQKYICCELVVAALEHLGIPGLEPLDQVDLNAARNLVRQVV